MQAGSGGAGQGWGGPATGSNNASRLPPQPQPQQPLSVLSGLLSSDSGAGLVGAGGGPSSLGGPMTCMPMPSWPLSGDGAGCLSLSFSLSLSLSLSLSHTPTHTHSLTHSPPHLFLSLRNRTPESHTCTPSQAHPPSATLRCYRPSGMRLQRRWPRREAAVVLPRVTAAAAAVLAAVPCRRARGAARRVIRGVARGVA